MKKLSFMYYDDKENLLESDTVPVVYDGADAVILECSASSLIFHLSDNSIPFDETLEFTAKLVCRNESIPIDAYVIRLVDVVGVTYTAELDALSKLLTVRVSTNAEGDIPKGVVVVQLTNEGTTYYKELHINYTSNNNYLGTISTADKIPTFDKINVGDYFVYTGNESISYVIEHDDGTTESVEIKPTYIYTYVNRNGYATWIPDTNESHEVLCLSDILNYINTNNPENYKEMLLVDRLVANSAFVDRLVSNQAFIDKLVTSTAFITNLFSKAITLKSEDFDPYGNESGFIKSDNWKEKQEGWKVRYDGNAEFNSVFIGGDAIFAGSIQSGPLYLDDIDPTSIETQRIFEKGTSFYDLDKYLERNTYPEFIPTGYYEQPYICQWHWNSKADYIVHNATYEGVPFTYIGGTNNQLKLYNKKGDQIASFYIATVEGFSNVWSWNKLPGKFVFDLHTPGGKTFKLINIPTSKSSLDGVVYKDSEGYLRIS